jgi:TetR/AcrR family transcriptional repressor of nem operon
MIPKISTRIRIIEAAKILIWRNGYNAVSVDSICAAADINKGSFYHAFQSKADLLIAVITSVRDYDLKEVQDIYSTDASIEEKFRRHLEWFGSSQRRLRAKYGFVPGQFNMALDMNVPEAANELVRDARRQSMEVLRAVLRAIVAPDSAASAVSDWLAVTVSRIILGAMIDARLTNSLSPFDTLPESILALIGLAPPPVDPMDSTYLPPKWLVRPHRGAPAVS